MVRSVAGLVVLRERLDTKVVNGEQVNTAVYRRLTNATRRVATTLGLEARTARRDANLSAYLTRSRDAQDVEDEDEEAEA